MASDLRVTQELRVVEQCDPKTQRALMFSVLLHYIFYVTAINMPWVGAY